MSTPIILAALPAALPAAPPAQTGPDTAQNADSNFSRILADQRRPADADDASDVASADAGRDQDDTSRADQTEDGLPDAPLAALALDIATQAAAQLRGAALRARADALALERAGQIDTAARRQAGANDNDRASSDLAALTIATNEADEHAAVGTSRPFSFMSSAAIQAATRQANPSDKPLAAPSEQAAVDPLSAPLSDPLSAPLSSSTDRSRDAIQAGTTTAAATSISHGLSRDVIQASARPVNPSDKPFAAQSGQAAVERLSSSTSLSRDAIQAGTTAAASSISHGLSLAAAQADAAQAIADPALHITARPDAATPLLVAAPVGAPQWGPELGRQLITLSRQADNAGHTAELRLDPPELGPLRVTLTLNEGIAHAAFASPHANVRQAVEAAMSQLQSALAQAGISLGQASVSDQEAPNQFASGQQPDRDGKHASGTLEIADAPSSLHPVRSDALVDTFA